MCWYLIYTPTQLIVSRIGAQNVYYCVQLNPQQLYYKFQGDRGERELWNECQGLLNWPQFNWGKIVGVSPICESLFFVEMQVHQIWDRIWLQFS